MQQDPSDASRLPKGKRLYQVVARQIVRLIEQNTSDPKWRLPSERELADILKVSRPSVREAIIALEMRGVVEVHGRAGIAVLPKPISIIDFDAVNTDAGAGPFEILEARKAVEASAAAIAATRSNNYDLAILQANIESMQDNPVLREGGDPTDREFHRVIADITGNAIIVSMVDALWTQQESSRLWKTIHSRIHAVDMQPIWIGHHYGILAALRSRNPDAAYKAMWQHIDSVAAELLEASGAEDD